MTDTYTVSRSIDIAAPPARIYEKIADFHNWPQWSPWEDMDPDMKREYSGAESGLGAAYAWSGNNKAGKGRMEIVEAFEPGEVKIDLAFEKPFKSRSEIRFVVRPEGDGAQVTWTMVGVKTVMTRMMSVVKSMDAMIGPDFEKGLGRLKTTTES
ncbi:polyketide cyclase/dehydrase/lipid transport protein [Asanoa ferruginea]|uniref:Polyketide cyclase/dehydrase/lipid transport protein n=1 Tax=Asanoa ferruginea TaxID=53367 RepID=A0A3D9ZRS5_9ACTN|nr:SRPBCC family protein [Asanoa ferruginea]REG00099.1 polyketide cyclase/dehydrase/lipid transport protein [Asanoa ferruginea]GIF46209.1 polyketide cyclase [Asanoa ferruginea]